MRWRRNGSNAPGEIYVLGRGTQQDVALGYAWISAAANSGAPSANALIAQIEAKLSSDQLTIARKRADEIEAESGQSQTHTTSSKRDSQGGRFSDSVQCTPRESGNHRVEILKCAE